MDISNFNLVYKPSLSIDISTINPTITLFIKFHIQISLLWGTTLHGLIRFSWYSMFRKKKTVAFPQDHEKKLLRGGTLPIYWSKYMFSDICIYVIIYFILLLYIYDYLFVCLNHYISIYFVWKDLPHGGLPIPICF